MGEIWCEKNVAVADGAVSAALSDFSGLWHRDSGRVRVSLPGSGAGAAVRRVGRIGRRGSDAGKPAPGLPFRKASQMLPPALRKEMEEQAPEEQYRTLCAAYETKNNEFNFMSVDRFLNHLLEDNSHTHAMENLSERVNSVLHSDTFGYRWSDYCLIYIKLEDYASYTLKNCNGHLLFDDFRRMYAAVHHAFSETLNERHVAHGLDVKEACVFLVNLTGTSEHTTQTERNACMEQLCRRARAPSSGWPIPLTLRWRWRSPTPTPMRPRPMPPLNGW